jgi:hypothetical protein
MRVFTKPGLDFSVACALPIIAYRFLATHPHRPAIREWFHASTVI